MPSAAAGSERELGDASLQGVCADDKHVYVAAAHEYGRVQKLTVRVPSADGRDAEDAEDADDSESPFNSDDEYGAPALTKWRKWRHTAPTASRGPAAASCGPSYMCFPGSAARIEVVD